MAELKVRNRKSEVVELARRLMTIMKILEFSGDQQFLRNHRGLSIYMTVVEDFFIYWLERHNLGPERLSQQNHRLREPLGHLDMVCWYAYTFYVNTICLILS